MTVTPESNHTHASLARVADALHATGARSRERGNHIDARCPAHEDNHASLSVDWRNDASYLCCHAGCDNDAVLGALGLTRADLYDEPLPRRDPQGIRAPRAARRTAPRPAPRPRVLPVAAYATAQAFPHVPTDVLPQDARTAVRKLARAATATYDYYNEHGTLLGTRVRGRGKRFTWRDASGAAHAPARRALYRLPDVLAARAAGARVWVVEGEKDAEALVACGEVATTPGSVTDAWRDEHTDALRGAHVIVVADDDAPGYRRAAQLLDGLRDVATTVAVVRAAEGKDACDHLAAGHGLRAFVPVAASVLHDSLSPAAGGGASGGADVPVRRSEVHGGPLAPQAGGRPGDAHAAHPDDPAAGHASGHPDNVVPLRLPAAYVLRDAYAVEGDSLVKGSTNADGQQRVREVLSVRAQLVRKVRRDMCDGTDARVTHYELRCERGGQAEQLRVRTDEWEKVTWPAELPWPVSMAHTQQGRSDVRNAIEQTSPRVRIETAYGVMGWRECDGQWLYLHAGGALGADGPALDADGEPLVRTDLPRQYAAYELPAAPADAEQLRAALAASLVLRGDVPARVLVPVLGATWRALLGRTPSVLYLRGGYGTRKTGLAAFALQHYAPGVTHESMPMQAGEDASTLNSLGELFHVGGDCLYVPDDLAPDRSASSSATRLNLLARAQYSGAGKARLSRDLGVRPSRGYRGTMLSTGEDSASSASAESRIVTLQLGRDDVPVSALREANLDGGPQLRAQLTSALVRYCARRKPDNALDEWRWDRKHAWSEELASEVPGLDARGADAVADLAVGWDLLTAALQDAGALDADYAAALMAYARGGLLECATAHRDGMAGRTYPERVAALLRSLFTAGRAHVSDRDSDNAPATPGRFGWVPLNDTGPMSLNDGPLRGGGDRLGWTDGDALFLDPGATLAAVTRQSIAQDEPLSMSPRAMGEHLAAAGVLRTTKGKHATQQRIGAGRQSVRQSVWVLPVAWLYPDGAADDDGPSDAPTSVTPTGDAGGDAQPALPVAAAPDQTPLAAAGSPYPSGEGEATAAAGSRTSAADHAPSPAVSASDASAATGTARGRFVAPAAVADGDGSVWLATGATAQRAGDVPALLDFPALLAWAEGARLGTVRKDAPPDPGQVWLTAAAAARYGIPQEGAKDGTRADLPALVTDACTAAGWTVKGSGNGAWLRAWRDGGVTVRVVLAGWLDADTHPGLVETPDAAALAARVGTYAALVGLPYRLSPAVTSLDMLSALRGPKGVGVTEYVEPCPPSQLAGVAADAQWRRKPTAEERRMSYAHAYDINAAYLSAAASVRLGLVPPAHSTAPDFDKNTPGYWKVTPPAEGGHRLLPDLLDPLSRWRGGDLWVTTPTLAAALDLGYNLTPAEAWVYRDSVRYLEPWYDRLRTARTTLLAHDDDTARAVLSTVKRTYAGGVGRLNADALRERRDPLYRPDWRHHVTATAHATMLRKLHRAADAGRYPLAVAVDAFVFASDEPDPVKACPPLRAGGAQVGTALGQVKVLGTAPMADVAQLLDADTGRPGDVLALMKDGA